MLFLIISLCLFFSNADWDHRRYLRRFDFTKVAKKHLAHFGFKHHFQRNCEAKARRHTCGDAEAWQCCCVKSNHPFVCRSTWPLTSEDVPQWSLLLPGGSRLPPGCQMNLTLTPDFSFVLYYPSSNFPACLPGSSCVPVFSSIGSFSNLNFGKIIRLTILRKTVENTQSNTN